MLNDRMCGSAVGAIRAILIVERPAGNAMRSPDWTPSGTARILILVGLTTQPLKTSVPRISSGRASSGAGPGNWNRASAGTSASDAAGAVAAEACGAATAAIARVINNIDASNLPPPARFIAPPRGDT